MPKLRTALPKETREAILHEFNHRCAICGKDRPQLHHIDENPGNNVHSNLLPLCPNHHLSDQHDPTRKVDPQLLALFRQYKDPQMLSSRFEPIFRRLKPLMAPSPEATFDELSGQAVDLASFVARLTMGEYYFNRLSVVLDWSGPAGFTMDNAHSAYEAHRKAFVERLAKNVPQAIALLVEQLRYQDWPPYEA
jgi:hypothetical protein